MTVVKHTALRIAHSFTCAPSLTLDILIATLIILTISDKQQILARRVEEMVIAVMKMEPVESIAEKKMKNELISVQEKLEIYEKSIKQLRDKMEYQRFKVCSHLDKLILSLIKSIY